MRAARLTLVAVVLVLATWRLLRAGEAHSARQQPERELAPAPLAQSAPERRAPPAIEPRTKASGVTLDERTAVPDTSAIQQRLEDVYGKERLEEAGATPIGLYSSRAHHQWLSIGSTLHHAGNEALATEVATFMGLLKRAMQPFTTVGLPELLEAERQLLTKVSEPRLLKLPLRGGGRSSVGAAVEQIERGNRSASRGKGPSVAEKIAEIEDEAARKETLDQADRKPWRSWSSDPDELQEEMADRRMPRPIDEQGSGAHGLEAPDVPTRSTAGADAAVPEP